MPPTSHGSVREPTTLLRKAQTVAWGSFHSPETGAGSKALLPLLFKRGGDPPELTLEPLGYLTAVGAGLTAHFSCHTETPLLDDVDRALQRNGFWS